MHTDVHTHAVMYDVFIAMDSTLDKTNSCTAEPLCPSHATKPLDIGTKTPANAVENC